MLKWLVKRVPNDYMLSVGQHRSRTYKSLIVICCNQVKLAAATTLSGGIQFQFFDGKDSQLVVSSASSHVMSYLCIIMDNNYVYYGLPFVKLVGVSEIY